MYPKPRKHSYTPLKMRRMTVFHKQSKWNIQGGPQKCSSFSLAITFTKVKKPLRFFLHRYWIFLVDIFLVEITLEPIMFYYTFSVINTMFVPCTTLLYDSTAATRTLKLSTTLLSISFGIRLNFSWWCPLLSVDCFHKLCLSGNPSENSQSSWDLGNRIARGYRFDAKWVCPMWSYAWGIQVFCSRNEAPVWLFSEGYLKDRVCENNPQTKENIIRR